MFARDFVRVHRPFEAVAPHFAGDPSWLEPIVDAALHDATALHGTEANELPIAEAERARCTQGPTRVRDGTLVVPWTWTFEHDPFSLSPVESDLTVAPVHATECALTLEARVRPPAGTLPVGAQHVVDEVLRGFLRGLAATIATADLRPAREERSH
jgi:hypothetical protein